MLLHFRDLERRGDELIAEDIIFTINDPVVIESKHLPMDPSTKRKPDLICLLAMRFRSLCEDCEDYQFRDCTSIAGDKKATKSNTEEVVKTTWGDILHSWELEHKGKISLEIGADFSADESLGTDGDDETSTPQGECALVS